MIDYEKLKEVHELVDKKVKLNGESLDVICRFYVHSQEPSFCISKNYNSQLVFTPKIDSLIKQLKDDLKDTAFIGQTVWFLDCTKIDGPLCSGKITDEYFNSYIINNDLHVPMTHVFNTREELINSCLQYWEKLKNE